MSGDRLRCPAIWNGCKCGRKPHPDDDRHVWMNTLDDGRAVDPAMYPSRAMSGDRLREAVKAIVSEAEKELAYAASIGKPGYAAAHAWSMLRMLREALAGGERGGGEGRIDAEALAMAMDTVDEEDYQSGVVGRGRKVDRIIAKYEALWSSPWSRVR